MNKQQMIEVAKKYEEYMSKYEGGIVKHSNRIEAMYNAILPHLEAQQREIERLREALKELTFSAETSGGTAGRDEHLCAAIAKAKQALAGEGK